MVKLKKPLWTLEEGLELVRRLQPASRAFGYHVALGGGVLNNGSSFKDVDVYLIPLGDTDNQTDTAGAIAWLESELGESENISEGYAPGPAYAAKRSFAKDTKRIDLFILRG
jgi:hypothetical protein